MTLDEAKKFIRLCYDPGTFESITAAFGWDRRQISNFKAHFIRIGVQLPALRSQVQEPRQRGPAKGLTAHRQELIEFVEQVKREADFAKKALAMAKYRNGENYVQG